MTAQPIETDGNLPAAMRALTDAIHQLTEPRSTIHNDTIINGPSLYMQLWDAVDGEATNGGGSGGGAKSRPPFWLDAFDLCREIDVAVECWQPAFTGVPATVGRLKWILKRKWRPQDTRQMEQITTAVQSWAVSIDDLMNPKPKWTLPNPCPNCGVKTVYRNDASGERVRTAALQINGNKGCTCQACRYTWEPHRFQILAGALGYALPTGVIHE